MTTADTARRSFTALVGTIESMQRSAQQLESILGRVDGVRRLARRGPGPGTCPRDDRFAERMREIGEAIDGPMASVLPNLQRLGAAMDRTNLEQVPEVIDAFTHQLRNAATMLADLPRRLGPLGELLGGPAAGMLSAFLPPTRRATAPTSATASSEGPSRRPPGEREEGRREDGEPGEGRREEGQREEGGREEGPREGRRGVGPGADAARPVRGCSAAVLAGQHLVVRGARRSSVSAGPVDMPMLAVIRTISSPTSIGAPTMS